MNGPPIRRPIFAVCLALVVITWLAIPAPVRAAPTARPVVTAVFAEADGWSFRKLLAGLNNRTRIIQAAVACMCLALVIIMRK